MKNIEELVAHPKNEVYFPGKPREWEAILEDIKENGVENPLILANDEKTILAGHLRMQAAHEAGIKEVPVEVKNIEPHGVDAVSFIIRDNIMRRQLSAMEWSRLVQDLYNNNDNQSGARTDLNRQSKGKTNEELANSVGLSKAKFYRLYKLKDLIPELQEAVDKGDLSTKAAYHLACLKEEEQKAILKEKNIEDMDTEETKRLRKETEEYRKELEEYRKRVEEYEDRANKLQKALDQERQKNREGKEAMDKLVGQLKEMEDRKNELEEKLHSTEEYSDPENPDVQELEELNSKIEHASKVLKEKENEIKKQEKKIQQFEFEIKDKEYEMEEIKSKKAKEDEAISLIIKRFKNIFPSKSEIDFALKEVEHDPYNNLLRTLEKHINALKEITDMLEGHYKRLREANFKRDTVDTSQLKSSGEDSENEKVVNIKNR